MRNIFITTLGLSMLFDQTFFFNPTYAKNSNIASSIPNHKVGYLLQQESNKNEDTDQNIDQDFLVNNLYNPKIELGALNNNMDTHFLKKDNNSPYLNDKFGLTLEHLLITANKSPEKTLEMTLGINRILDKINNIYNKTEGKQNSNTPHTLVNSRLESTNLCLYLHIPESNTNPERTYNLLKVLTLIIKFLCSSETKKTIDIKGNQNNQFNLTLTRKGKNINISINCGNDDDNFILTNFPKMELVPVKEALDQAKALQRILTTLKPLYEATENFKKNVFNFKNNISKLKNVNKKYMTQQHNSPDNAEFSKENTMDKNKLLIETHRSYAQFIKILGLLSSTYKIIEDNQLNEQEFSTIRLPDLEKAFIIGVIDLINLIKQLGNSSADIEKLQQIYKKINTQTVSENDNQNSTLTKEELIDHIKLLTLLYNKKYGFNDNKHPVDPYKLNSTDFNKIVIIDTNFQHIHKKELSFLKKIQNLITSAASNIFDYDQIQISNSVAKYLESLGCDRSNKNLKILTLLINLDLSKIQELTPETFKTIIKDLNNTHTHTPNTEENNNNYSLITCFKLLGENNFIKDEGKDLDAKIYCIEKTIDLHLKNWANLKNSEESSSINNTPKTVDTTPQTAIQTSSTH